MGPTELCPSAMFFGADTVKHVPKGWGYEKWIQNNKKYCGKHLHVAQGRRCSLHGHINKHETFHVVRGKLRLWIIDERHVIGSVKEDGIEGIADVIACTLESKNRRHSDLLETDFGQQYILEPGHSFVIPPGVFHQFYAVEQCDFFEFSTPHYDNDVIRLLPGDSL